MAGISAKNSQSPPLSTLARTNRNCGTMKARATDWCPHSERSSLSKQASTCRNLHIKHQHYIREGPKAGFEKFPDFFSVFLGNDFLEPLIFSVFHIFRKTQKRSRNCSNPALANISVLI